MRGRPTAAHDPFEALARAARADLDALRYPDRPWLKPMTLADGSPVEDVIVVGGGQSGLFAAASLRREGLARVVVLDRAPPGGEGPWTTYARMPTLRTPKILVGNEFGIPNLSLKVWYETCHAPAPGTPSTRCRAPTGAPISTGMPTPSASPRRMRLP
ncbi:FAD-dependent oxidoreductase [Methylobrevis pamukkalensis]|uniref:Tricarballylate dehydrogenase n=1 Tax=Methylobrevis pamukkalensis TaxID=1439726 RepID=A0A1E3GZH2_9HYPH|nr:FAD-dependent oxidoreductase [Methylobrevis pamukkalensis]ODN69479.1 tricarballylate dehydrogenase [Methylobrevis pamukkalensis]